MEVIHRKRMVTTAIVLVVATIITGTNIINSTYADDVTFSTEVEESLVVSLSASDVALTINPQTTPFAVSSMSATVRTNNAYGYTLNVRNNTTTNLTRTEQVDGEDVFMPTLTNNEEGYTENNFETNHWGYKTGSGNFQSFTGLFELGKATGPTNGDVSILDLAAKIDYEQPAGIYTTELEFVATATPPPVVLHYMQDVTADQCREVATEEEVRVYDKRDESDYTVRYFNNKCWMTQNLRITGTISAELSNFTGEDVNITVHDLDDSSVEWYDGESEPRTHLGQDSEGKPTAWYNFAAVTAGTITNENGANGDAAVDICPSGWRLPTKSEFDGVVANNRDKFHLVTGGMWRYNSAENTSEGYWWSSTVNDWMYRYGLIYWGGELETEDFFRLERSNGIYARCVLMENINYSIVYDGNTEDSVTNMPSSQEGTTTATSVQLSANVPERSGWGFNGWCLGTNTPSQTAEKDDCNGAVYAAGSSIDSSMLANGSTNLSALWKKAYTITYSSNGGSGTVESQVGYAGDVLELRSNGYVSTDNYFAGWVSNNDSTKYRPAQKITPTSDMALTANWIGSANTFLYDAVASLNYSSTGIMSSTRFPEKSNSGVSHYSSQTESPNDEADDYEIYIYNGILDYGDYEYGGAGDSANFPNYIRLSNNTCWRIIRTTGSGGIKVIYNGRWASGTCANSGANSSINGSTYIPFNSATFQAGGSTYYGIDQNNIHSVGYTYSSISSGITSEVSVRSLVGASGDDTTTNNIQSTIKQYTDKWYQSNMTSFTSNLEPSAGYCNDRTIYNSTSYVAEAMNENDNIVPYGTSGATKYYFGSTDNNPYVQWNPADSSLKCQRGKVDIYSTSASSVGNGQLTYPIAQITKNEAAMAGAGRSYFYSRKSYINSGISFWTMTPQYRGSDGKAYLFEVKSGGYTGSASASWNNNIRPVISLKHSARITSGSGTATSPWVICF